MNCLSKYAKLKAKFHGAIKSHKLARATKFNWLGPKEVIYFIARRHIIRLYQALVVPVPLSAYSAWVVCMGNCCRRSNADCFGVRCPCSLSSAGEYGDAIDWSNDYYIVTNQRVIWLEKVVGLYDSRQEAPLSSILSVGVETDQLGRILDYGNVIVRTFVGKLEFDYVDHPNQAAEMIREYWERIKSITTVSQKDVMKNTIRAKIGMPVEKKKEPELPPVVAMDESLAKQPLWWIALKGTFSLRKEDAGKIIYHKHWIVLFAAGMAAPRDLVWPVCSCKCGARVIFSIHPLNRYFTEILRMRSGPIRSWSRFPCCPCLLFSGLSGNTWIGRTIFSW